MPTVEDGSRATVGVVVLHWGPIDVTRRCLQSLSQVHYPGTRIFLVDNALTLPPSAPGWAFPLQVQILRPERNLGFSEGSAWGVSEALKHDVDYVLLLNNDAVVDARFLDCLVDAARKAPGAGLLCPQVAFLEHPDRVWYAGGQFSLWSGIPRHTNWQKPVNTSGPPREVDFATGCAVLIQPSLIRAIGSFDSRFFAYCEDVDLSIRARQAGFTILIVPASLIRHSAVYDDQRLFQRTYYSTRNLLEVMAKHATWVQWLTFIPNFLTRWIGFFLTIALLRRRPRLVKALTRGVVDFARRRLGERSYSW